MSKLNRLKSIGVIMNNFVLFFLRFHGTFIIETNNKLKYIILSGNIKLLVIITSNTYNELLERGGKREVDGERERLGKRGERDLIERVSIVNISDILKWQEFRHSMSRFLITGI